MREDTNLANLTKMRIDPAQRVRIGEIASFWLSLLSLAPGLYIGLAGITDDIGPTGFAGLSEMAGFFLCAWGVFRAMRLLLLDFLGHILARTGCLAAAVVLALGWYLLMDVTGTEASMVHKRTYTDALQLLGWFALALLAIRVGRWTWRRVRGPLMFD